MQRILVAAIGGGILLITIIVVMSLLFGGSGSPTLLKVAQAQTELIRVSQLGSQKATSPSARALAVTTLLSVETAQKETVDKLKEQGQKTNDKLLGETKNSQTDAALTAAAQNNRYDETFRQIMESQLAEYQNLLQTAFNESKGASLKQTLSSHYSQAGLLITSAKSS
jgi:hypothetical protein